MNETTAHRTVLIASALMVGAALLQSRNDPGVNLYRRLWAVGLLTLGLSVASDMLPRLTGPFAVLLIVAVAIRQRGELGSLIGNPAAATKGRTERSTDATGRVTGGGKKGATGPARGAVAR